MKRGRDKDYKCIICGRFIAYEDIPDKIGQRYTPDTDFTNELIEMWHKDCEKEI